MKNSKVSKSWRGNYFQHQNIIKSTRKETYFSNESEMINAIYASFIKKNI